MLTKTILVVLLNALICFVSSAQSYAPLAEKSAVIYVVRNTRVGSALTFRLLLNENLVGIFKGKGCLRYDLPAGQQLLWASSQNRQSLNSDVKPGGTYLISFIQSPGLRKNNLVLKTVFANDSFFYKRKEVVRKNKPIVTLEEKKAEVLKTKLFSLLI